MGLCAVSGGVEVRKRKGEEGVVTFFVVCSEGGVAAKNVLEKTRKFKGSHVHHRKGVGGYEA